MPTMPTSTAHSAGETNPKQGGLVRSLTWRGGTGIALAIPSAVVVTLGASVGALGALTAILLWLTATIVGILQNVLFSEMAGMFPNRSGGIARYAIEGWKRHFAPLGAIASFGYWMAWSFSLSVFAVTIGALVKEQWFSDQTWSVTILGGERGLEHLFGIVAIVAVWAMNYFGVKNTARLNIIAGVIFLIGVAAITIGGFTSESFSFGNFTWGLGASGGWIGIVVWYYLTAWTTYGTEMVASFAPEYRNPVRDTAKAFRSIGFIMVAVVVLLPLAMVGSLGEGTVGDNPYTYVVIFFTSVLGQGAWMGTVLMIVAMFMAMNAATADGGRALFGLAQDGMTLKQFSKLNRWNVPGRAMTLDAVLNIAIVLAVGSPLAILLAGNLGYLTATTLAVAAFLLLRKDLPKWPRPIRLRRVWIFVAVGCLALNTFVLAIGVTNPEASGYGGFQETAIGIGILLLSVVLYAFRRMVQDRLPMAWRIRDSEPQEASSETVDMEHNNLTTK